MHQICLKNGFTGKRINPSGLILVILAIDHSHLRVLSARVHQTLTMVLWWMARPASCLAEGRASWILFGFVVILCPGEFEIRIRITRNVRKKIHDDIENTWTGIFRSPLVSHGKLCVRHLCESVFCKCGCAPGRKCLRASVCLWTICVCEQCVCVFWVLCSCVSRTSPTASLWSTVMPVIDIQWRIQQRTRTATLQIRRM